MHFLLNQAICYPGFEVSDLNGVAAWVPTASKGADMLKNNHLDILSFASNHTMDCGDEALKETLDALEERGIRVMGAGMNIHDARKPIIVEKKGTKIGFLAYCSVCVKGSVAGADRPGVCPMRAETLIKNHDMHAGMRPDVISRANKEDLAAMVADIKALRSQVDVLVVSMHWGVHWIPDLIADYQFEVGHAAIDAGADIIIGQHAHIMKGIEVYKGKVIFHGLGNFSMRRTEGFTFKTQPAAGRHWIVRQGIRAEADPSVPRYPYDINSHKNIIVKLEIEDKKISKVGYVPLWINKDAINMPIAPNSAKSEEHLDYVRWLCGSQGLDTTLEQQGDEVVIKI